MLLRTRHKIVPGQDDDFTVRTAEEIADVRTQALASVDALYRLMADGIRARDIESFRTPARNIVLLVDVSGSMYGSTVSAKSDMDRARAACALAAIMREVCEEPVIYATAGSDSARKHKTELVPARHGMALVDAIYDMCHPLGGGGIFVRQVMDYIAGQEKDVDRVVMITDEQDTSGEGDSFDKANLFAKGNHYMINVGSYEKSVGYGKWVKITGFSEAVVKYITAMESNQQ